LKRKLDKEKIRIKHLEEKKQVVVAPQSND
jgi:hypothetical protein